MGRFDKEKRSGGNRNFGSRGFNNDRPEMHSATCANCGKLCEVPFRPTGSKPVFCRDCFNSADNSGERRSETRSFGRSGGGDRQMFDAVCSNCGRDCQIPFRPTQGRDVLCSRCFDTNESGGAHRPERKSFDKPRFARDENRGRNNEAPNYNAQFAALNAKMDQILSLLTPASAPVAPLESVLDEKVIEEIVEDIEEEKEEKVTKPKKVSSKKTTSKTKKPATPKKK